MVHPATALPARRVLGTGRQERVVGFLIRTESPAVAPSPSRRGLREHADFGHATRGVANEISPQVDFAALHREKPDFRS